MGRSTHDCFSGAEIVARLLDINFADVRIFGTNVGSALADDKAADIMAITRTSRNDPIRKLEIVTLTDEYGAQMILQHPLTIVGYDRQAEETAAIALMEANAAAYKAAIGGQ